MKLGPNQGEKEEGRHSLLHRSTTHIPLNHFSPAFLLKTTPGDFNPFYPTLFPLLREKVVHIRTNVTFVIFYRPPPKTTKIDGL